MNIGLLSSYFALGSAADSGIGQHYLILADALAALGHKVHVVHPTTQPDDAATGLAALSPRWTCEIAPVRPPRWAMFLLRRSWPSQVLLYELCAARAGNRALARAAARHSLEIVETHATASPALFYLKRRQRPPVVTRVSTSLSQMNTVSTISSRVKSWQVAIERATVRASDALITHTVKHRDAVCAAEGYDPDAFAIIPHGLPDIVPPSGTTTANPAHPDILFVGRFEHRKGIDVLLDAIPAVLARHPGARFTLAGSWGDGVSWHAFKTRFPGLADRSVAAPGMVSGPTLDSLYSRCDMLVAPSRYESFGLIYVEAMRYGKPVIGCDAGGIPEVVSDGVTGLLAKPGDVDNLTACICRLLDDPELSRRLGRAGRADYLQRFSAARMAARSVEFYTEVIARRQRAGGVAGKRA